MKSGILFCAIAMALPALAGPYSKGFDDPENPHDAPVPGFIGPHGIGQARLDFGGGDIENPDNYVNPIFFGWANGQSDYLRSDLDTAYNDPGLALGPVTGDFIDVVSLGDLTEQQIAEGVPSGRITLAFAKPIRNRPGADFVVFENAFFSLWNSGGAGYGGVLAELAYVEVSANGVDFHRFPSVSLTPSPVGGYGSIDPTNVFGLAGKHINAYGESWGTPFDLGQLGLEQITHIRIVDIPGNGAFQDSDGRPIHDAWRTTGSGGFDLEAIGAISVDMSFDEWPPLQMLPANQRGESDDPDGDGIPNLLEYAFGLIPWEADAPAAGWSFGLVAGENGESFSELTTRRDERLSDLILEIEISDNLENWHTFATSTAGAPYHAAAGHNLSATSQSAGDIASIGVIRKDILRDLNPVDPSSPRFYRLKVTRMNP